MAETVRGGVFLVGNRVVNANNEPLEGYEVRKVKGRPTVFKGGKAFSSNIQQVEEVDDEPALTPGDTTLKPQNDPAVETQVAANARMSVEQYGDMTAPEVVAQIESGRLSADDAERLEQESGKNRQTVAAAIKAARGG